MPDERGADAGQEVPSRGERQVEPLCPCLIVPDGMEFVFAVPEALTAGRQQTTFSIVDLTGQPLSFVAVSESAGGWPSSGIYLQMLDKTLLAWVSTKLLHDVGSLPYISRANGEAYASFFAEEGQRGRSYILKDGSGNLLYNFLGDFREKSIKVVDRSGQLVCTSERSLFHFDMAPHYQVRVGPLTDAGLILCGLLAIDKIEGSNKS